MRRQAAPGVAILLILVGLLIKSEAFLPGFWLPKTHAAISAEISALLSGSVVTAGIAPLSRLGLINVQAAQLLLVLGLLSVVIGGDSGPGAKRHQAAAGLEHGVSNGICTARSPSRRSLCLVPWAGKSRSLSRRRRTPSSVHPHPATDRDPRAPRLADAARQPCVDWSPPKPGLRSQDCTRSNSYPCH